MTTSGLERLTRTLLYEGKEFVVVRAGITLVMYSDSELGLVMKATANSLAQYLRVIPPRSIATTFEPGPDEHTPGKWRPFDSRAQDALFRQLSSGSAVADDDGFGFVLSGSSNGEAASHAVRFGGIDLNASDSDSETSLLRFDFPADFEEIGDVEKVVDAIERIAADFPFSAGYAGLAFVHNIAFVPEAREEIQKLWPRFLGFDVASDSMQLEMRGKACPPQWLNLLGTDLIARAGGEQLLRETLAGCEMRHLSHGLLIRAAKRPPVGDANRGAKDLGLLPTLSRALQPIRFDRGLFVGLQDEDAGIDWLGRLDGLPSGPWNNG